MPATHGLNLPGWRAFDGNSIVGDGRVEPVRVSLTPCGPRRRERPACMAFTAPPRHCGWITTALKKRVEQQSATAHNKTEEAATAPFLEPAPPAFASPCECSLEWEDGKRPAEHVLGDVVG